MLKYSRRLKSIARILRNEPTDSEQVLWSRLRRKQVLGIQFYRQKPVGRFVVDFYAPAVQLVIEVDGSQHFDLRMQGREAIRTKFLEQQGLQVLRFHNRQVLLETDAVMATVFSAVEARLRKSPRAARDPLCPRG